MLANKLIAVFAYEPDLKYVRRPRSLASRRIPLSLHYHPLNHPPGYVFRPVVTWAPMFLVSLVAVSRRQGYSMPARLHCRRLISQAIRVLLRALVFIFPVPASACMCSWRLPALYAPLMVGPRVCLKGIEGILKRRHCVLLKIDANFLGLTELWVVLLNFIFGIEFRLNGFMSFIIQKNVNALHEETIKWRFMIAVIANLNQSKMTQG